MHCAASKSFQDCNAEGPLIVFISKQVPTSDKGITRWVCVGVI
jgi:hypothetical protein